MLYQQYYHKFYMVKHYFFKFLCNLNISLAAYKIQRYYLAFQYLEKFQMSSLMNINQYNFLTTLLSQHKVTNLCSCSQFLNTNQLYHLSIQIMSKLANNMDQMKGILLAIQNLQMNDKIPYYNMDLLLASSNQNWSQTLAIYDTTKSYDKMIYSLQQLGCTNMIKEYIKMMNMKSKNNNLNLKVEYYQSAWRNLQLWSNLDQLDEINNKVIDINHLNIHHCIYQCLILNQHQQQQQIDLYINQAIKNTLKKILLLIMIILLY